MISTMKCSVCQGDVQIDSEIKYDRITCSSCGERWNVVYHETETEEKMRTNE